jgi:hypothetical protein
MRKATIAKRRWVGASQISALAGVMLAVAACGGSGSGSGSSSTSAPSGGGNNNSSTSSPSGSSTSTPGGGNSAAAKLGQIAANVQKESTATFKLTYKSTSTSGSSETITLEQLPPKQLFVSGSSRFVFDGTNGYYCQTSSTPATCIKYGKGASNPISGLVGPYDGSTALSAIQTWKSEVAAGIVGYHVSYSTATFAGQSAQCVQWSYQSDTAKYCVTNSGVLAYEGGGSGSGQGSFELTAYSSSPSASDFALPSGATITSIP